MDQINIPAPKGGQTVILTYEVAFGTFDELLALLNGAYEDILVHQPGFLGAAIHVNDARTRVASYSQWESREAFLNVLKTPEMQSVNRKLGDLSKGFEPVLYDIERVHMAAG